jgi:hypothetical protein
VWNSRARPQEAEVVIDFGNGAYRGSGITIRGLLIDGDRWTQTLDHVDIGSIHLTEELPGIRGERFDIATLALGKNGVKR